jgi:prepilin-type N-terminal cleavage/methylation domain-containing protein
MTSPPISQAKSPEVKPPKQPKALRSSKSGFSLVELLVVIGVISSLASIAIFAIGNITGRSKAQKLRGDIATLNSALRVYESNGGSLADIIDEQDVLNRLKTESSNWKEIAGLRRGMIDPRLEIKYIQDAGVPRAKWDSDTRRFFITDTGKGVKEFVLNNDSAQRPLVTEVRDAKLKLAKKDTWVWDYKDHALAVNTVNVVSLPNTPPATFSPPSKSPLKLNLPTISEDGGTFDLASFPPSVYLRNPNDSIPSILYYSINSGSWQESTGEDIPLSPDMSVSAYVASSDKEQWQDSDKIAHFYSTTSAAPGLSLSFSKSSYNYMELGGEVLPGIYEPVVAEPGKLVISNLSRIPKKTYSVLQIDTGNALIMINDKPMDKSLTIKKALGKLKLPSGTDSISLDLPVTLNTFGSDGSATVSAIVRSSANGVVDSNMGRMQLSRETMELHPPNLSEVERPDGLVEHGIYYVRMDLETTLGDTPSGARIYYTKDGSEPVNQPTPSGSNITLYEKPILVAQLPNVPIRARVYGPEGEEDWFEPSPIGEIVWPPPANLGFTMTVSTKPPSSGLTGFLSTLSSGELSTAK